MSDLKARGAGRFKKSKLLKIKGRNVLAVGCGDGKYLEFCRLAGLEAVGIDISEELIATARERYAAAVLVADAGRLPFAASSFDAVTLWDVLEHVEDDVAALKEAARVARSGILISVPAEDVFPDYSSGVTFRTYSDLTHRRYYDVRRLENLLSLCGLDDYTIERFDRVRPALLYRRTGIPRFFLSFLDRLLWALGSKPASFLRNYFVEVRLPGGSEKSLSLNTAST